MSKQVVIVGACGRMGKTLVRCLAEERIPELRLSAAVDIAGCPGQGEDVGPASGTGDTGVTLSSDLPGALEGADAAIDFSSHKGTAGIAKCLADAGVPLVIGTTGFGKNEEQAIQEAAGKIPVVLAPNMSLGINLLFNLVEEAARALKGRGYDIEIVERHHRRKKDSPSGTALGLGRAAAKGLGQPLEALQVDGRTGISEGDRPVDEIGFHAVRGGDFVGDHTVIYAAEGECVELSHRATTRETFALGALRAADWVTSQKPGLFTMQDVLGL